MVPFLIEGDVRYYLLRIEMGEGARKGSCHASVTDTPYSEHQGGMHIHARLYFPDKSSSHYSNIIVNSH